MSTIDIINDLITLGTQIKNAATKSNQTVSTFLGSADFASISVSVSNLLQGLQPNELQKAIDDVRVKEKTLLAGKDVTDLKGDALLQFHALTDLEHGLVIKLLKQPNQNSFLSVLVNEVLPVLVSAIKVIAPLF